MKKQDPYKSQGFKMVAGYRIRLLDTKKGKRYQVDLGTKSGKHVRRSFNDKNKAEQFARDSRNEALNDGITIQQFTARQKTDALEAIKILKKHGVSLRDSALYFDKHHQAVDASNDVGQLVEAYLAENAERVERGELRPVSYAQQKRWLKTFKESYTGTAIDVLTAKDIDAYLDVNSNGATIRANSKRYLSVFFNWCVSSERLDTNPMQRCRKIKKAIKTPKIYTPAQVKKIMDKACDFETTRLTKGIHHKAHAPELVCYLALGFFGGLRPQEVMRVRHEDIDLELGEIHVNTDASKTSRARIVHISPNLAKYLAQYGAQSGLVFPMSDSTLNRWIQELFRVIGIKSIQDGARHTFATMHLAQHDSIDTTLLELGHVDSKMLFQHYHGLASNRKAQAKKYWMIEPEQTGKIIPMQNAG